MNKAQVAEWEGLPNRTPAHALVADVDLVVVRLEDSVSVLYGLIHELAANGLEKVGHHGAVAAMGVPRQELPTWDWKRDVAHLTGVRYGGVTPI